MSATVSTIEQYYTNILQRPADSLGLSYWINQVANGTSLNGVETAIATSTEAQTYIDPIVQLYEGIFGRAPDPAGLKFWVSLEESGTSVLQIAEAFVGSPEGQAELGATLNTAAIETLYENALGRMASTSEVDYWLNSGLNLGEVAYSVAESQEADVNLASPTLSYLLNAGAGVPSSPGTVIDINGSALTYTGTSGNDTFYAANGAALTTGTTINGNGGSDALVISNFEAATAVPPYYYEYSDNTIAPTLNGVSTVEITNSPDQSGTVDLSLSTGATTAELMNSSGGFSFLNAGSLTTAEVSGSAGSSGGSLTVSGGPGTTLSSLTTATISDSYKGTLTVSGASASGVTAVTATITGSDSAVMAFNGGGDVGGTPVSAVTMTNSPGAYFSIADETAPALTITVSNSPKSTITGSATTANITSLTGDSLTDLTLALTASTAATLDSPDVFNLADSDVANTAGIIGLQTLTVNSTGAEQVSDSLSGTSDGVANAGTVTVTGSGSLGLVTTFSALTTFNSTGYTGSLQAQPADAKNAALLAKAAGSTLPTSYAGLTTADAGLIVSSTSLTSITTGSGNSVIDLADIDATSSTPIKSVTVMLGSGDNVLFLGNTYFEDSTFNGGTGKSEVIGIGNGDITASTAGNTFSNFSVLEIGPNSGSGTGGTGTYDLAAFGATLTTVALTGTNDGLSYEYALSGPVILDQAPNALSVVETAYPGEELYSADSLQVNLGNVTPTGGTYNHSVSFVLNADSVPTTTTTPDVGTVYAENLTVGQDSASSGSISFAPGSYSETVNLASNINASATTVPAADYSNFVGTLDTPDATTLAISDQASLAVDDIDGASLKNIMIGGGAGDVSLYGFTVGSETSLKTIDASGSSGTVFVNLDGSGATGFTYDGSSGADTVYTDDVGGDTFNGAEGNDTFNLTNTTQDTFDYTAVTDANVTDTNKNGIFLNDLGTTLNIETINGFLTGTATPTKTDDSINLTGFTGNGYDTVLISSAGAGPITGTTDLTSVPGLFTGAAGEQELTGGQGGTVGAATAGQLAGAFVYQNGTDNVEVFVAAGAGTSSFAAGSDLAINLYNAGGLSATAVAHDLKFT